MNAAKTYAIGLAESLTKITMTEFFQSVHDQFYPEIDISFMGEFLEMTEHEDEFVVHHSKLLEYGIMTSTQSAHVKSKLETLGMEQYVDYILLTDVCEQDGQHGGSNKKAYYLTPETFKKCLMRAQKRSDQPVDPTIYCDYYLLLEKVHKLFTDYERAYSAKLLSLKDDTILRLEQKIDDEREAAAEERRVAKEREDAAIEERTLATEERRLAKEREEAFIRERDETTKRHESILAQFGLALTDREAKHNETIAELHLTQIKVDNATVQLDQVNYTLDEVVSTMQDTMRLVAPVPSNSSRDPILAVVARAVLDKDGNAVITIPMIRGQRSYVQSEIGKFLIGNSERTSGKMKGDVLLNRRYQLAIPPIYIPDQTNLVDNAKRAFADLCKQRIKDHNDPIIAEIKSKNKDVRRFAADIAKLARKNAKIDERLARTSNSTKADAWRAEMAENTETMTTRESAIAAFTERIAELESIQLYSMQEISVKFNMTSIRYRSNRVVTYQEFVNVFIDTIIDTRNTMFSRQDIEELNTLANEQHTHLMAEIEHEAAAQKLAVDIGNAYNEMSRKVVESMTEVIFQDEE